jgi:hypothetical protein
VNTKEPDPLILGGLLILGHSISHAIYFQDNSSIPDYINDSIIYPRIDLLLTEDSESWTFTGDQLSQVIRYFDSYERYFIAVDNIYLNKVNIKYLNRQRDRVHVQMTDSRRFTIGFDRGGDSLWDKLCES